MIEEINVNTNYEDSPLKLVILNYLVKQYNNYHAI